MKGARDCILNYFNQAAIFWRIFCRSHNDRGNASGRRAARAAQAGEEKAASRTLVPGQLRQQAGHLVVAHLLAVPQPRRQSQSGQRRRPQSHRHHSAARRLSSDGGVLRVRPRLRPARHRRLLPAGHHPPHRRPRPA